MKILIIGGNRFFGKRLTHKLIQQGHDVTTLNRGRHSDDFGDQVTRITCDRTDVESLERALSHSSWDLVYDQVCFDYNDAKSLCDILNGKTKKLIFTSSQSVYESGENLTENLFDATIHPVDSLVTKEKDYGEAKRQAEVAFQRHANFPVTSVRFPIVLGSDDYTGRFLFHIERIQKEKPLFFPNLTAKMSFINSETAANALQFLGTSDFSGPINVASPQAITLGDFIHFIEDKAKKKAVLLRELNQDVHSPYGIDQDWYMDCHQLKSLGFTTNEVNEWLPHLIEESLSND